MLSIALTALKSPLIRSVLFGGAAVLLLWAYIGYAKHQAASQARTELTQQLKAATDAENQRREAVLIDLQRKTVAVVNRLAETEKHNESLQRNIARLSAANDSTDCLDADSVQRLRQIGQPPGGRAE